MSREVPQDHVLCRLFRAAIDAAFKSHRNLYAPGVAAHLSDGVLSEFVHMDRVYRLKNADGRRLQDLPEMLELSARPEGPERRLEVDRYIGDFALFMVGFFPTSVQLQRAFAPDPMISRVGKILVQFTRPVDYYVAEGRNAYQRASETARLFDPDARETFSLLSEEFDGYRDVIGSVKEILADSPQVEQIEQALDDEE